MSQLLKTELYHTQHSDVSVLMILNIPPWPALFQTLSSWATSSVEEVASTGPGIRFFQLYVNTLKLHYYCTT
jgi:hypothetical protein